MKQFDCYLALGDSISIDLYPSMDERVAVTRAQPVGAASLFFRNNSALWPEFEANDLDTLFPKIYYSHHAEDGYRTEDMLLPEIMAALEPFKTAKVLATLTLGGNDLLGAIRHLESGNKVFQAEYNAIEKRYQLLMDALQKNLPNALFLISTVYDPTDGTGIIPGDNFRGKLPIEYLTKFNNYVRSFEKKFDSVLVCDIHKHFLGHGADAGADMWYWLSSPIEPGARGASEIRRVWLKQLEKRIKPR
jgi:hypothetical protein